MHNRFVFILYPFINKQLGKLWAFCRNMRTMFSGLHSLNLLHKSLAEHLRAFYELKAQSRWSLGSKKSIFVLVHLRVKSTDLQKHFAQISGFVELVRKCLLYLIRKWYWISVNYRVVQTIHIRCMEFTWELWLTFWRDGTKYCCGVYYAVVVSVERGLDA